MAVNPTLVPAVVDVAGDAVETPEAAGARADRPSTLTTPPPKASPKTRWHGSSRRPLGPTPPAPTPVVMLLYTLGLRVGSALGAEVDDLGYDRATHTDGHHEGRDAQEGAGPAGHPARLRHLPRRPRRRPAVHHQQRRAEWERPV